MKILFVCQQYIHAARWINQLKYSDHDVFVFDCLDATIHEELEWTSHFTNWSKRKIPKLKGENFIRKKNPFLYDKIESVFQVSPSEKLIEIIDEIKPDLVHSLEMQSQTYHVLKARRKRNFKWAYFSWGSDIYLYQNQKKHRKKMQQVFSMLDYLFVDNNRDIKLARELNYQQAVSGVFPGGGGYHLQSFEKFEKPFNNRDLILIKGYHHWAGRALQVLESIELIINDIKEYEIYVYSAHNIVIEKIEELNKKYNLSIQYSSRKNQITHDELLRLFGKAKIAIGNNITDGIPNTLLESIILGAFPIQSNPGNVSEDYVIHGDNGYLIQFPEDSRLIAELIKDALSNNDLLRSAYEKNKCLSKLLDYEYIKNEVLKSYKAIESQL